MNQPNQTNIQYPLALNLSGNIVSAVSSPKKSQYTCIECQTRMKLCGGNKQQFHFRHYHDTDKTCSPESVIHKAGKIILKIKIDDAIAGNTPLNLIGQCSGCGKEFATNLVEHIDQVMIEKSLFDNKCRPDLLGFKNNKPIIALEIVNTHYPEQQTLQNLEANGVRTFVIRVKSNDDLITNWQDNNITGYWAVAKDDFAIILEVLPLCKECKPILSDIEVEEKRLDEWQLIQAWENRKGTNQQVLEIEDYGIVCGSSLQDELIEIIHFISYDELIKNKEVNKWIQQEIETEFLVTDIDYVYLHNASAIITHESPWDFIKYHIDNNKEHSFDFYQTLYLKNRERIKAKNNKKVSIQNCEKIRNNYTRIKGGDIVYYRQLDFPKIWEIRGKGFITKYTKSDEHQYELVTVCDVLNTDTDTINLWIQGEYNSKYRIYDINILAQEGELTQLVSYDTKEAFLQHCFKSKDTQIKEKFTPIWQQYIKNIKGFPIYYNQTELNRWRRWDNDLSAVLEIPDHGIFLNMTGNETFTDILYLQPFHIWASNDIELYFNRKQYFSSKMIAKYTDSMPLFPYLDMDSLLVHIYPNMPALLTHKAITDKNYQIYQNILKKYYK